MDKREIISFFDSCAPLWDKNATKNERIIKEIFKAAGIKKGVKALDIACGTGVLFPDYEKAGTLVTGIDISPEMVKIAREKFPSFDVICGDAESYSFKEKFDCAVIYNAFPHFPFPNKLIENISYALKKGGRITVAHGMSEEALHRHHERAREVSLPLPSKEELSAMLEKYFVVDIAVSDNEKYIVSAVKKLNEKLNISAVKEM